MLKNKDMIVVLKKLHARKYTFQKYKFFVMLILVHVWLIYTFHNFSNFYIKFRTCILSPTLCYSTLKPNAKCFKNISKIKNLFLSYFRPLRSTGRSTVTVSGQIGRPGLLAVGVHVVHVCRSTRSIDRQVLWSTDQSTNCMTLALGLCRSTGPVD